MYNYISMNDKEIKNSIYNNTKCTLAMSDCDIPYLVPMCYKVKEECENLYIILKSKNDGKKMNYINCNSNVCILIETKGLGTYKTVILNGCANVINECNDDSIIEIYVTKMSGRIFCY